MMTMMTMTRNLHRRRHRRHCGQHITYQNGLIKIEQEEQKLQRSSYRVSSSFSASTQLHSIKLINTKMIMMALVFLLSLSSLDILTCNAFEITSSSYASSSRFMNTNYRNKNFRTSFGTMIHNHNEEKEKKDRRILRLWSSKSSSSSSSSSHDEDKDDAFLVSNTFDDINNHSLNSYDHQHRDLVAAASVATQESCTLLGIKSIGVDYGLVRTGIAVTVGYDPKPLEIIVADATGIDRSKSNRNGSSGRKSTRSGGDSSDSSSETMTTTTTTTTNTSSTGTPTENEQPHLLSADEKNDNDDNNDDDNDSINENNDSNDSVDTITNTTNDEGIDEDDDEDDDDDEDGTVDGNNRNDNGHNTMDKTIEDAKSYVCQRIIDICKSERADQIIVGLPLHKNGTEAEQSNITRQFAMKLANYSLQQLGPKPVPVYLFDERYTSKEAAARIISSSSSSSSSRSSSTSTSTISLIDADAACIILENYYNDNGQNAEYVTIQDESLQDYYKEYWYNYTLRQKQYQENLLQNVMERSNWRKQAIEDDRRRQLEGQEEQDGSGTINSSKKKKKKKKKKK